MLHILVVSLENISNNNNNNPRDVNNLSEVYQKQNDQKNGRSYETICIMWSLPLGFQLLPILPFSEDAEKNTPNVLWYWKGGLGVAHP